MSWLLLDTSCCSPKYHNWTCIIENENKECKACKFKIKRLLSKGTQLSYHVAVTLFFKTISINMDLTGRIVQCDDFTNGVYHVFTNNSPVLNREVNQRYICIYFLLSILSCIYIQWYTFCNCFPLKVYCCTVANRSITYILFSSKVLHFKDLSCSTRFGKPCVMECITFELLIDTAR